MIPWAVLDLHEILDTGLLRGDGLLIDEEVASVATIRALTGPAALTYARLTGRKSTVFLADDVEAVAELVDAGLLADEVDSGVQADHATVEALKLGCRRLGLPAGLCCS